MNCSRRLGITVRDMEAAGIEPAWCFRSFGSTMRLYGTTADFAAVSCLTPDSKGLGW